MRAQISQLLRVLGTGAVAAILWGVAPRQASLAQSIPFPKVVAQDSPYFFLHGTGLTGAQWQVEADSLASAYRITDSWPTIGTTVIGSVGVSERGGYASVASMQSQLNGLLSGSGPYGVVAHSSLGLVSRDLIQLAVGAGQQSKINHLLTIATPHKGAHIAQVALDAGNKPWPTIRRLDQRFALMNHMWPAYTFTQYPDQTAWYTNVWFPVLQQMTTARSGLYVGVSSVVGYILPITADLDPRSSLYLTLNSLANLREEGGTARSSIVGVTSNTALFSKAWLPLLWPSHSPASLRSDVVQMDRLRDYVAKGFWTWALWESATLVAFYLQNGLPPCMSDLTWTYSCFDQASGVVKHIAAAVLVDNLNRYWASWVGARGDNTSDGWLPDSTQFYPGLDTVGRYTLTDAYHGLETRESGALVAAVLQRWGVPARQPPPPPLLSNSITQQGSYFTAHPAGGRTPYSFLWEWCITNCSGGGGGGQQAAPARGIQPNRLSDGWTTYPSTEQSINWTGPHPATLRSTVTDASGSQAVATYYIQ